MRLSENTVPIVMIELIVGLVFLLVILVSASLVKDRIVSLSHEPEKTLVTPPPSESQSRAETLLMPTLAALENKVDSLSQEESQPAQPLRGRPPNKIEGLLERHVEKIVPRFEALNKKMDALLVDQEAIMVKKLAELDSRIESLKLKERDTASPLLGELSQKAETLSYEHDTVIAPTLKALNEKVDLLLGEEGSVSPSSFDRAASPAEESARHAPSLAVPTPRPRAILAVEPSAEPSGVPGITKILQQLQTILSQYGIVATLHSDRNAMGLPQIFDFERGSSTLSERQLTAFARLSQALGAVLPCYANLAERGLLERCSHAPDSVKLDTVFIKGFAAGDTVGTERFSYNWRLANGRSIQVLKALLIAQPNLVMLTNPEGASLFEAIGEHTDAQRGRSRRVELQFSIAKPEDG
ncbi:MAG: hypothetical protein HQL72_04020 [Magnetococcales bacterium]|nr:hypothetical protein [Magnetococcales bacterium]